MHIDDAEENGFFWESRPRSRKRRKCAECFRWIEIGERYHSATGVTYDGLWSSACCRHCDVIARAQLIRECGGCVYGEVREDLAMHGGDAVDAIIAAMDAKWLDPSTGCLLSLEGRDLSDLAWLADVYPEPLLEERGHV